ncbi:unnamed protein product, partial [Mesorhabditis belari]|uniref:Uncharacterized protein n=1 Tax=Mesorhabditis belari TaxID=2138241 RepID=A0AAF3F141_9BILA
MREKRVSCAPEQTKKEDSAGNSSLLGYQTSPLANRSHLSTIFSESELEHELEKDDDIGELSELKSIAEPLDFKKASFSSIASSQGRADFVSALDTINQALEQSRFDRQKTPVASSQPQQGIPSFKSTHIVLLTDSKAQQKMDSPPNDFSPNASPRHGQNMAIPDFSPRDHSNPESIDSTGFEKVERPSDDVLEQYSQNFASQMQQSIFGQLPDDPDCDGFELIEKPKNEMRMGAQGSKIDGQIVEAPGRNENDVQVLERISGDIDAPNAQPMQRPRDDILEKSYGEHPEHGNDDLIDIPRNEQPHQHHDFLDDYQDHPPQPAPRHPTPPRDDFADLLAPVGEIDQHQQQNLLDFSPNEQQPSPPSPPAYPFHLDYPKETQAHDEDPIREHVEDVHDDVDAMIARMNQNMQEEPEAHPASPSGDSGRDTVGKLLGEDNGPQFGRQTPEELMIDREGPLTIPELPETLPQEDEEDELDAFVRPPSIGHHGFETEPRPPTPPKDISDEDVKPSAIQIPGAHHHHHAHKQHSILKHAGSGPWIDFKTVDPRD